MPYGTPLYGTSGGHTFCKYGRWRWSGLLSPYLLRHVIFSRDTGNGHSEANPLKMAILPVSRGKAHVAAGRKPGLTTIGDKRNTYPTCSPDESL